MNSVLPGKYACFLCARKSFLSSSAASRIFLTSSCEKSFVSRKLLPLHNPTNETKLSTSTHSVPGFDLNFWHGYLRPRFTVQSADQVPEGCDYRTFTSALNEPNRSFNFRRHASLFELPLLRVIPQFPCCNFLYLFLIGFAVVDVGTIDIR